MLVMQTWGEHINIGCGAIFVNYDGINKHRSKIEDKAFIGSNANIVAPVHIGEGLYCCWFNNNKGCF